MSWGPLTNQEARTLTARKRHVCSWCGEDIQPGERYVRWPWMDGRQLYAVKAHLECDAAWGREGGGEAAEGACRRGMTTAETLDAERFVRTAEVLGG